MRIDYRLLVRLFGVILTTISLLACGAPEAPDGPAPLWVATSIPPHAWLVEQIGGDLVRVVSVLGPGDSPATHQPTDAKVSRILTSRVFFSAGVPFESGPWFQAISRRMTVVDLRTGVELLAMDDTAEPAETDHESHAHSEDGLDPHIWLSPARVLIQARTIADTLNEAAPDHAPEFRRSLEALTGELEALDRRIANELEPYSDRAFVVFHPSWGYLAHDYGLRQIAIEIDGKEPSDEEISRVHQLILDEGVSAIFVQPQIAGTAARAVAASTGARLETMDPLAPEIIDNQDLAVAKLATAFDD